MGPYVQVTPVDGSGVLNVRKEHIVGVSALPNPYGYNPPPAGAILTLVTGKTVQVADAVATIVAAG